MPRNCVIIGDIKKSRSVRNWSEVVTRLGGTLRDVNGEFSDDILVHFRLTVGDEFQGALNNPGNAYRTYLRIKHRLPVDFYWGIGIGGVEKPLSEEIGMRGTAFYRARDAVQLCKRKNREIMIISAETVGRMDRIANTLFYFLQSLEGSWTKRQREVIDHLRAHPDYTYEQLASNFGISKQAVYRILKAANWDAFSEGETLVNELLEHFPEEDST